MTYKNWTIETETDTWAILFGSKVKFYIDGERIYSASDVEEAMQLIDDIEQPLFV